MRCPKCGHNHPKKEGKICGGCRYEFVFRPDEDNGWTDGKFLGLITAASSQETNYFTENQLYTTYCRKQKKGLSLRNALLIFVILAVISGISGVPIYEKGLRAKDFEIVFFILAVFPAIGLLIYSLYLFATRKTPPSRDQFKQLLRKWTQKKGIEKLITTPRLHTPPPEWKEADIYDYGAERVLIVDRDILVDLLVLNGFHAQERTLVISANRYPDYLMPHVEKVLTENPELPVFFLHDSTSKGMGIFKNKQLSNFPSFAGHPVIDLGIFPEDVPKIRRIRPTKPITSEYAVEVDLIPYNMLSSMTAEAVARMIPFNEAILAATDLEERESYFSGGSFG